jgi:hypothetical protein
MRMAEIIKTKTAKYIKDKRCEPTYIVKREVRLREAFPEAQGLTSESSTASPCGGILKAGSPASDGEAAHGGGTGQVQPTDGPSDCIPSTVHQSGEDDCTPPAVHQQLTNGLSDCIPPTVHQSSEDDCTPTAVHQGQVDN